MGFIDQSSCTKSSLYLYPIISTDSFFLYSKCASLYQWTWKYAHVSGTRKVFRFIQFCNRKPIYWQVENFTLFWNNRRLCEFPRISHFNGEICMKTFFINRRITQNTVYLNEEAPLFLRKEQNSMQRIEM